MKNLVPLLHRSVEIPRCARNDMNGARNDMNGAGNDMNGARNDMNGVSVLAMMALVMRLMAFRTT